MARGGSDAVEGVTPDGELRVRVRAAPVDGQANRALVALIARELGVGRTSVTLDGGATARRKRLRIDGPTAGDLARRWPGLRLD